MALQLGDVAPDFEAETTEGRIKFHDWIGDSWAVLFSHPKDFTPVCTTELGYMASIEPEFAKRNVKIIGLSVDPLDKHEDWAKDIEETQGTAPNYPIISDADFQVSKLYGMLPADVSGEAADRTPVDNQTVRNVFVIGPDKKIKLILVYPMTTGRNFDEVLRVVDSLQLTAEHKVATPAQWQQGDDVIIAGSVSNDQAKEIYPEGWEEPRPYIRIVPQPVRRVAGAWRCPRSAGCGHARCALPCASLLSSWLAEDPRGRSPDQMPFHLVGGGVDGDAAADQASHLVALAEDVEREGEDGLDLGGVRLQVELAGVGDAADEGVDAVAGDEGAGGRQLLADLDTRRGRGRSPPAPRAARSRRGRGRPRPYAHPETRSRRRVGACPHGAR